MSRATIFVVAAAAGTVLFGTTSPAARAWPIPITPEEQNYINRAHATGFPGDDDQMLMAGRQSCQLLYSGTRAAAAANEIAGRYNADPGQAAALVRVARGILCTQAPG
ncbi:DUF732 domain-containing protein [Mycolicibacterium llatzerense]|uniref:DUF732 domain-containing protein n=1 Tax=Mycolicibacterium llatzerense TaxID=280871 RepID=UPI0008DC75C8|nr:DUF732 domain-containing protein [Mycolicibacterium llatzerense]